MTYSLVACDLEARQWGVAVQSKFPAIGALCAWARPEVGALATQAFIRAAHGPAGLRLLDDGLAADVALERLVAADEGRDDRQLGIVDRTGRAAAFTGTACMEWAGHRIGDGYAAQGNLLVSGATVDALAETFEATVGSLAARLLAAMRAAQAAGGDRRGQQSAALLVVARGGGYGGADVVVDLRIDDHPRPLDELARLMDVHELHFGSTPPEQWVPVDDGLARELRERLAAAGFATGDLAADLDAWAGVENLEERIAGAARIDPVVLDHLRQP